MDKDTIEKINKFTRREFAPEELYTFSVILCDNDIDRDGERFSDDALDTLKELFIGKTGIFDHSPSADNQNARIYDTSLETDTSRTTADGREYKYLRGFAYMIRTDKNASLIAEIDGGIKKEVSISCSAAERKCSVCGCDKSQQSCGHQKGRSYNGKLCHTILSGITDAYEWSFVAVPAQVNAGVTKKYTTEPECIKSPGEEDTAAAELRRDIRRMAFFTGGRTAAAAAELAAARLTVPELSKLKRSYEKLSSFQGIRVQLAEKEDEHSGGSCFKL